MTYQQTRARARVLFPQWSRRMRAKWVVARLKVSPEPRVPISTGWDRLLHERLGSDLIRHLTAI